MQTFLPNFCPVQHFTVFKGLIIGQALSLPFAWLPFSSVLSVTFAFSLFLCLRSIRNGTVPSVLEESKSPFVFLARGVNFGVLFTFIPILYVSWIRFMVIFENS